MTDMLPIIIAALAAGAILLIFVGLAGGSSVDPVQARLTQLTQVVHVVSVSA